MRRPGVEPGSTAWKATMLTVTPPTPSLQHPKVSASRSVFYKYESIKKETFLKQQLALLYEEHWCLPKWSSGQDSALSPRRPGFDSPLGNIDFKTYFNVINLFY